MRSGFKFRIHSNKKESYLVFFSLFFSLRMQINVFRGWMWTVTSTSCSVPRLFPLPFLFDFLQRKSFLQKTIRSTCRTQVVSEHCTWHKNYCGVPKHPFFFAAPVAIELTLSRSPSYFSFLFQQAFSPVSGVVKFRGQILKSKRVSQNGIWAHL